MSPWGKNYKKTATKQKETIVTKEMDNINIFWIQDKNNQRHQHKNSL
jgi:hypothetical protein